MSGDSKGHAWQQEQFIFTGASWFTQLLMDWELKTQGSRLKNIVLITDSPPKPHTVSQEETEHSLAAWGSPGMPTHFVLTYLIPHDASRLATCLFVPRHQIPLPSLPASAKCPSLQT